MDFYDIFPHAKASRTTAEVDWKCDQGSFTGVQMNPKQKLAIIKAIENGTSRKFICNYLTISNARITKILKVKKDEHHFSDLNHRPESCDAEGIKYISNEVLRHQNEPQLQVMVETELNAVILVAAKATQKRRGHADLVFTLASNTMKNIKSRLPKIRKQKGQVTSKARQRESVDIRNFVTTAVMNECFAGGKPPSMIGNHDATQYAVNFTNNQLLITIEDKEAKNDDPVEICEESTLGIYVKFFLLCCAAGKVGMHVYLLADPSMNEHEYTAEPIIGLSSSTEAGVVGYLCFCKSRAGNKEFYDCTIETPLGLLR